MTAISDCNISLPIKWLPAHLDGNNLEVCECRERQENALSPGKLPDELDCFLTDDFLL